MKNADKKVYVVIGPTASGKSDFAVDLALKMGGEIISADSRQIYRGLDIGTGKITEEEMKGVPHHLLDICDLGERYSVAHFQKDAQKCIEEIFARGKTPILCGGTGQYIYATLYETSLGDTEVNESLRKELSQKSVEELFALLERKDWKRASTIDRHNKVRLIRALEILETHSEVPIHSKPKARYEFEIYEMTVSKELLRARIEKRFDKRMELGMLDEVKVLVQKNPPETDLKRYGIEYVELAKHLRGESTLIEARKKVIEKSWQYAKRQMTWNKKYFKNTHKVDQGEK